MPRGSSRTKKVSSTTLNCYLTEKDFGRNKINKRCLAHMNQVFSAQDNKMRVYSNITSLFLSLGALRNRITFGRGHRLLQGRHLVRGPCNTHVILVILLATKSFSARYNFNKVLLTFIVLELLLGTAELVLGPLEALLQSIDLRSQCGRGQQHSLQSHIDILFYDSCVYLFKSSVQLFFPNTEPSIRGYCLCGTILHISKFLPQSLLEGYCRLRSARSWRVEPSESPHS